MISLSEAQKNTPDRKKKEKKISYGPISERNEGFRIIGKSKYDPFKDNFSESSKIKNY